MNRWILYLGLTPDEPVWKLKKILEAEAWEVGFLGELSVETVKKTEQAVDNLQEKVSDGGYLFLTDDSDRVAQAVQAKVPVVYYERPGNPAVYHADITVLDLTSLDSEFFKRVYRRHFGLPWIIAETPRLLIRESVRKDFDGILELYEDEAARSFLFDQPSRASALQGAVTPSTASWREAEREKFAAYIRMQYPYFGYGLYTVIKKETGTIVGRIGFGDREYRDKVYLELGYLVGAPYRRQGIAFEAAMALSTVMEELTGKKQAVIFCRRDNYPSRRTAEKLCLIRPEHFHLIVTDQ